MANEQNLRPGEHKFTQEEAKKGGRASAEARRNRASLRKALEVILETERVDKKSGMKMTGAEAMALELFKLAMKGDVRAWEVLRDTAGQKPADKVQSTAKVLDMSGFTTEQIKEMLDDEV